MTDGNSDPLSVVLTAMSRAQFPFLNQDLLHALLSDDNNFQGSHAISLDLYSTLVDLDNEADQNAIQNSADAVGIDESEVPIDESEIGIGGVILRLSTTDPATSDETKAKNSLNFTRIKTHAVVDSEDGANNGGKTGAGTAHSAENNGAKAGDQKKQGWVKPGKTPKGTKPGEKKVEVKKEVKLKKNQRYEFTVEVPSTPQGGKGKDHRPRLFVTTPCAPYRKIELTPVVHEDNVYFFRFVPLLCGAHEIDLVVGKSEDSIAVSSLYFLVTSPIQELADALSDYLDSYSWAWGGVWSSELEAASMEMLGAVDEFFTNMIKNLKPLLDMMKSLPIGRSASLEKSRDHLETAMAKAIVDHDGTSIGRAFEAVRELLSSTNMMMMMASGPQTNPNAIRDALFETAKNFDLARVASLQKDMSEKLEANRKKVVIALRRVGEVKNTSNRLTGLRTTITMDTPFTDFQAYQQIEPLPMMGDMMGGMGLGSGSMGQMMGGSDFDVKSTDPSDLQRLPCISETKFIEAGLAFLQPDRESIRTEPTNNESTNSLVVANRSVANEMQRNEKLQSYLTKLSEPLYGGAFMLGPNLLNHYALLNNSFERSRQALKGLFSHGCCYVVQGEPDEVLVGTMDHCSCWRDLSRNKWEDSTNTSTSTSKSSSSTASKSISSTKDGPATIMDSFETDAMDFGFEKSSSSSVRYSTSEKTNTSKNPARAKRLKDVVRVLKIAKREGLEFQLGINVGFDETIDVLRKYHGTDNWVGRTCKDWWKHLRSKEDFFLLQLWLVDVKGRTDVLGASAGGNETVEDATPASAKEPAEKRRKQDEGCSKKQGAKKQDNTQDYSLADTLERVSGLDDLQPVFEIDEANSTESVDRIPVNRRTLIGADFCHVTVPPTQWTTNEGGEAASAADDGIIYVATRYSSNHALHRKWQPGFMLAFLAQNFLRQIGFRYWDLGGANGSPMMSYKFVVAEPLSWQQKNFICNRLAMRALVAHTSPPHCSSSPPQEIKAGSPPTSCTASGESAAGAPPTIVGEPGPQKTGHESVKRSKIDPVLFSGQVFSPFIVPESLTADAPISFGKTGSQELFKNIFEELKGKVSPTDAALKSMNILKKITSLGLFSVQ